MGGSTTTPSKNFADMVDENIMIQEAAARGKVFNETEKQKFHEMLARNLADWNGNAFITNNFGATFTGWVQTICTFLQTLIGSLKETKGTIGDRIKGAFTKTSEFSTLGMADQATMHLHAEMTEAGGALKQAADMITGQISTSNPNPLNAIDHNVYAQLRGSINLPPGSSSSLDNNNVGIQAQTLPNVKPNNTLTRQG